MDKNLDHALNRVHCHTLDGHSYGLAIHKASEETGTPQKTITDELARRRKANREKRDEWKKPQPHWQD